MRCLSCGKPIRSKIAAICSEDCRQEVIEIYEGIINSTPICAKNRSQTGELREDLKTTFTQMLKKIKAAPLVGENNA